MTIHFNDSRSGELIVNKNGRVLDRLSFHFDRNLEQVLLEGIDKILERNKMDLLSLKKMRVGGLLKPESLTYQVAQTFIKALKS